MESCCMNMIKAGGFIVFSACLAQYVVYWLPGDFMFRGVITGIIEITTGINQVGMDFGNARFLTGMIGKVPFRFEAALAVLVINAFHELSVPHTQVLSEVFLSLELVVFFELRTHILDARRITGIGTCKVIYGFV
jgi:hypothetical protein